MHPVLQALMMAARGHQGLPPQIQHAQPPVGPGMPGAPAPAASPQGPQNDRQVAVDAAEHLHAAVAATVDPQLRVALATALAALTKYLANDQKEQHQALAGKLSPRLMAQQAGR